MVVTSWLYGLELRLLHAHMYVWKITAQRLNHYFQLGNRSKKDRTYRIYKFVHSSYYWWQYSELGDRSKNDLAYWISKVMYGSYHWWHYFQLGDRSRNDCAYRTSKFFLECESVPCKWDFFHFSYSQ